jgi:hypothetical protein
MKNFFFALVFIFLAFIAWQHYGQAGFNFKLDSISWDKFKELDFSKSEKGEEKKEVKDLEDLKINDELTVPKEVLICLIGAKDNLETAMAESYTKSDQLLSEALDSFNQCQKKEESDIEDCYQDYLIKQNEIVESIKLERININNAYQFNLQLCWPDVSEEDLELIFNKI